MKLGRVLGQKTAHISLRARRQIPADGVCSASGGLSPYFHASAAPQISHTPGDVLFCVCLWSENRKTGGTSRTLCFPGGPPPYHHPSDSPAVTKLELKSFEKIVKHTFGAGPHSGEGRAADKSKGNGKVGVVAVAVPWGPCVGLWE